MKLSIQYYLLISAFMFALAHGSMAQKPILPDFHADPSVHYWDGKFWMFPSTDETGSSDWVQMRRWNFYSSENLVDWQDEGEIFDLGKGDIAWAKDAAFAPDAIKWKGKYYFFFPAGKQIGVAVSNSATGPFKDALGKPLISRREMKSVASFDPSIFIDDDNTPYLYYGGGHGAAVVKLKDNLIEKDGRIQKLDLKNYAEGIWVHKYKGTYYFTYPMTIDRNGCKKQLLVYSTSKNPTGPFIYGGVFLDNNGRNSHHSIINVKDKWYLFYHIEGLSGYERKVCVDYLTYDKNGGINEVKMTKKGILPLE